MEIPKETMEVATVQVVEAQVTEQGVVKEVGVLVKEKQMAIPEVVKRVAKETHHLQKEIVVMKKVTVQELTKVVKIQKAVMVEVLEAVMAHKEKE